MSARIDTLLSKAGLVARRKVAHYLAEHVVLLNGERVETPGTRIPSDASLTIDGKPLAEDKKLYILYHKPVDVVSTVADEFDRPTAVGQVSSQYRIYPVGRLDKDTSGLLLLTNDGQLTYYLTHPRFHVPKHYRVACKGLLTRTAVHRLETGIPLKHGRAAKAKVVVVRPGQDPILELEVVEGRNHLIRRMCKAINLEVISLLRFRVGPLTLDILPGEHRPLRESELTLLMTAAGLTRSVSRE